MTATVDGKPLVSAKFARANEKPTDAAYSITKSITSILVGIAQDNGLLHLNDPASRFITEWRGTDAANVEIRHLLSGTAGRYVDARTDYIEMAGRAADKSAFAIGLSQVVPPGTSWNYDNAAVQSLETVLERATGMPVARFAEQRLFAPLGMVDTSIDADESGNPLLFAGLLTTCDDLLRFGHMMLKGGQYEGKTIVSREYVTAATQAPSSEHNAAYGLLWWLNRPGQAVTPDIATKGHGSKKFDGQLVPDAPEDTFWALGFRDQILVIIPSMQTVAVRLGDAPPPTADLNVTSFTSSLLDVIR